MDHQMLKDSSIVPPSAVAIKISNILDPYFIRIYEIKHHSKRINAITKKLLSFIQQENHHSNGFSDPKPGDAVIVHSKFSREIELPSWCCRGICGRLNSDLKYNVFLPDYGISIKLLQNEFLIVPHNCISEDYLTYTIGIYNILPVTKSIVTENWSEAAINFTRELLKHATGIYFDHIGQNFGELYLETENNIFSLSEALVHSHHAIYLKEDLLKTIESISSQEVHLHLKKQWQKSYSKPITNHKEKEKVLIYSEVHCKPLSSVLDARFPVGIHKSWDSMIKSNKPKRIQCYIWPAIKKGLNVIQIGPAGAGKTVGYSAVVAGLLAMKQNLPTGRNPTALILCASSNETLSIYSLFSEFLQSYNIKCVAAFNGKTERSLAAEIYNGCQVLISTPAFLVRFLKPNKNLLNFSKLQYVILDSADVILNKYFASFQELCAVHNIMNNKSELPQMIVSSRIWSPALKKFNYSLKNNYVCIASFLEAAIFKSLRPKMHVINSKRKNKMVLDLLLKEHRQLRTMVICTTSEEVNNLDDFLSTDLKTIVAHENMNFFKFQGIKKYWDSCISGAYPILICSDEVLSEIDISNIDWLIHYSISLHFKTQFSYRFSTVFENLQKENTNCKITIIADENNDLQFQSIVKTMLRMGAVVPENILNYVQAIRTTLDKNKIGYPLCNNLKSFGRCPSQGSCVFRHCILPEVDSPLTAIQKDDRVKLVLTYVHDATHFSARVTESKSKSGEIMKFSSEDYIRFSSRFLEYYRVMDNRVQCSVVNVGDICTLEDSIESFKRVQVLCDRREGKTGRLVDVRCIDTGVVLRNIKVQRLLVIPECLAKFPIHTVEVFLSGIQPYDQEDHWNDLADEIVHKWFDENFSEQSFIVATVNLHLSNTIWVDTLQIGTKIIGCKDMILGSSLKEELLSKNYVCLNLDHIPRLLKLCQDGKMDEIY